MKTVNNYILLVDNYRRPSRQRNTEGRYRVAAKSPDEAVKLLRERIKFGSIQVYYMCNPQTDKGEWLEYKQVKQEVVNYENSEYKFKCVEPHSAIDPYDTYKERENNND